MQGRQLGKRDMLKWALLAPLGGLAARSAAAQDGSLFGVSVPRQLLDFIPGKPLNIARMLEKVIRLEKEADLKRLPQSLLSRGKGASILPSESAYQALLPRLVALIDRSELRDLGLAEQAGALLAELHGSVHELPEALRQGVWQGDSLLLPDEEGLLRLDPASPPGDLPLDAIAPPEEDDAQPEQGSSAAPLFLPDDADRPLSKSREYALLQDEYARLYRTAAVRPAYAETVDWHLTLIRRSKARYQAVGASVDVPWYFIAVIHGLEASFNFRAHLHNGDHPLTARTRQVPAGRPSKWLPPSDWESSARDALRLLGFTGQSDWSLERTLFRLEAYNGMGYRPYQVATPYLWSFSNHYSQGKYVGDSKWSATAKSQQCGAAIMLKGLEQAGDFSWLAG